ncbi:MAG: HAD-IA family hydrolase [Deltaproteobacteria bacterium]|nr:HAD-IA family hydrolase [Deltaproteobacteria bacterium]
MKVKKCKGIIFDLDGVITGTARVHGLAWESMFNDYLKIKADRDGTTFVPFDRERDYLEYVDGKPRMKGVESFLASRGIELPFGDYDDPPKKETVCGLGNRKNKDFQKVLRKEGPDVFASTIDFIKACKKRGIKTGVASSSRNCKLILDLGGIEKYFETRVCGIVSRELNLSGKPNSDIFVTAANNMGLQPCECVVVEDAISGVQAGRNGNFGLTLGIARGIDSDTLIQNGADLVVSNMGEISLDEIEAWFDDGVVADGWNLIYTHFESEDEKLRETLTAVGNGYLGNRGSFEGETASDVHYPGTYIAGVYNKPATIVGGRRIYNNDFVNCPNWTLVEVAIGRSEFVSPLKMRMLSYKHSLNMKEGVVSRTMVVKDTQGRITRIGSRRVASMNDPHLCAIQFDVTPLNYSGTIRIRSAIDGRIINDNVARYRQLNQKHLSPVSQGKAGSSVFLHTETNKSKYQIVIHAKTAVYQGGNLIRPTKTIQQKKGYIAESIALNVSENTTCRLEKMVSVFTSLDKGGKDSRKAGRQALSKIKSFSDVYEPNVRAWANLWKVTDIRIDGDRFMQKAVRLHIYHLLVAASPHNVNIDAGITARGLHGEAYRGHVFWDELYILPFYNLRFPQISKALLMYRYRRLDGARQYAEENGYNGAMYPWQTADGSDEETQSVHFNPAAGSWGPDLSRRQRHVSIVVFYNVWRYVEDTGDRKFLHRYGAEMMLEIARFWASIAQWDDGSGKYSIAGVMGPDEFHEKQPGSKMQGVKDNAYTNIMVVWLLEKAMEVIDALSSAALKRLKERIGFEIKETEKWKEIRQKLNINITKNGIISQFDGYMALKELNWDHYRGKYGDIHRMDRILKAEGDSPDHYKVAKQADTLMTYYVLSPEAVGDILTQLGYPVADPIDLMKKNYAYYEQRTSHGSTLSKVVHAIISSYMANEVTAWEWFVEAMESDIYDTQGGTTPEGIHCGVMAGTLDVITRYFAGIDFSKPVPQIAPNLPEHWKGLVLEVHHRNKGYHLDLSHDKIKITLKGGTKTPQPVKVNGKTVMLSCGKTRTIGIRS